MEYRIGDEVREIMEGNGTNCPRVRDWRETECQRWLGYGLKALVKPDIILVSKGEALVVDVTVRNVYDPDKTPTKD